MPFAPPSIARFLNPGDPISPDDLEEKRRREALLAMGIDPDTGLQLGFGRDTQATEEVPTIVGGSALPPSPQQPFEPRTIEPRGFQTPLLSDEWTGPVGPIDNPVSEEIRKRNNILREGSQDPLLSIMNRIIGSDPRDPFGMQQGVRGAVGRPVSNIIKDIKKLYYNPETVPPEFMRLDKSVAPIIGNLIASQLPFETNTICKQLEQGSVQRPEGPLVDMDPNLVTGIRRRPHEPYMPAGTPGRSGIGDYLAEIMGGAMMATPPLPPGTGRVIGQGLGRGALAGGRMAEDIANKALTGTVRGAVSAAESGVGRRVGRAISEAERQVTGSYARPARRQIARSSDLARGLDASQNTFIKQIVAKMDEENPKWRETPGPRQEDLLMRKSAEVRDEIRGTPQEIPEEYLNDIPTSEEARVAPSVWETAVNTEGDYWNQQSTQGQRELAQAAGISVGSQRRPWSSLLPPDQNKIITAIQSQVPEFQGGIQGTGVGELTVPGANLRRRATSVPIRVRIAQYEQPSIIGSTDRTTWALHRAELEVIVKNSDNLPANQAALYQKYLKEWDNTIDEMLTDPVLAKQITEGALEGNKDLIMKHKEALDRLKRPDTLSAPGSVEAEVPIEIVRKARAVGELNTVRILLREADEASKSPRPILPNGQRKTIEDHEADTILSIFETNGIDASDPISVYTGHYRGSPLVNTREGTIGFLSREEALAQHPESTDWIVEEYIITPSDIISTKPQAGRVLKGVDTGDFVRFRPDTTHPHGAQIPNEIPGEYDVPKRDVPRTDKLQEVIRSQEPYQMPDKPGPIAQSPEPGLEPVTQSPEEQFRQLLTRIDEILANEPERIKQIAPGDEQAVLWGTPQQERMIQQYAKERGEATPKPPTDANLFAPKTGRYGELLEKAGRGEELTAGEYNELLDLRTAEVGRAPRTITPIDTTIPTFEREITPPFVNKGNPTPRRRMSEGYNPDLAPDAAANREFITIEPPKVEPIKQPFDEVLDRLRAKAKENLANKAKLASGTEQIKPAPTIKEEITALANEYNTKGVGKERKAEIVLKIRQLRARENARIRRSMPDESRPDESNLNEFEGLYDDLSKEDKTKILLGRGVPSEQVPHVIGIEGLLWDDLNELFPRTKSVNVPGTEPIVTEPVPTTPTVKKPRAKFQPPSDVLDLREWVEADPTHKRTIKIAVRTKSQNQEKLYRASGVDEFGHTFEVYNGKQPAGAIWDLDQAKAATNRALHRALGLPDRPGTVANKLTKSLAGEGWTEEQAKNHIQDVYGKGHDGVYVSINKTQRTLMVRGTGPDNKPFKQIYKYTKGAGENSLENKTLQMVNWLENHQVVKKADRPASTLPVHLQTTTLSKGQITGKEQPEGVGLGHVMFEKPGLVFNPDKVRFLPDTIASDGKSKIKHVGYGYGDSDKVVGSGKTLKDAASDAFNKWINSDSGGKLDEAARKKLEIEHGVTTSQPDKTRNWSRLDAILSLRRDGQFQASGYGVAVRGEVTKKGGPRILAITKDGVVVGYTPAADSWKNAASSAKQLAMTKMGTVEGGEITALELTGGGRGKYTRNWGVGGDKGKDGGKVATTTSEPVPPTSMPMDIRQLVDRLAEAVDAQRPLRTEQAALHRQWTRQRTVDLVSAGKSLTGEDRFYAQLKALGGEMPKVGTDTIYNKFTKVERDALLNYIEDTIKLRPRDTSVKIAQDVHNSQVEWITHHLAWDRFNAKDALHRVFNGELISDADIKYMGRVFGRDLVKKLMDANKTGTQQAVGLALDYLGAPTALVSSGDFSWPFRQGLAVLTTHPKAWFGMWKPMIKAAFNKKEAQRIYTELVQRPYYSIGEESGLEIPKWDAIIHLSDREEGLQVALLEKAPHVAAANQGFVTAGNVARAAMFDRMAQDLEALGYTMTKDPKQFAHIADYVNTLTGRGHLPLLQRHDSLRRVLGTAMFSPRYFLSRWQLLGKTAKAGYSAIGGQTDYSPYVRDLILKDSIKSVGLGLVTLGAIKWAASSGMIEDVDVEADPRSSDFGKVRIGDTAFDMWGGHLQNLRFLAQFFTARRKAAGSLEVSEANRFKDILPRYLQSKAAPLVSSILEEGSGETFAGEDLNKLNMAERAAIRTLNLIAPLSVQDIWKGIKSYQMDWMLAPIITYSLTGGGVETHYRPEHHVPGLRMYENVDKLAAHTVSDFFGGSDKDKEELERKLIAYGNAIKKGAAIEQKNAVGDRVVIDTYTRLKSFYSNKILWDYQNYGLVDYLRTKNQTETGFTPTQPKLDTDLPNPEPSGDKPKNLRGPWPQGYTKDSAANTFGPRWGIENPLVDGKHQPLYFNQLPKE